MASKKPRTDASTKPKLPKPRRGKFGDPFEATIASLIDLAKARAKRKHVPYALSYADIPWLASSRVCPITGLPLVTGTAREGNRPHPLAPSLDRIEATKGYVRGNVRIVSWWANSARNSLTDEQFAVFVEAAFRTRQYATLH